MPQLVITKALQYFDDKILRRLAVASGRLPDAGRGGAEAGLRDVLGGGAT